MKRIHIDASRIRSGGGVLHAEMLISSPDLDQFDQIIFWTYPSFPITECRKHIVIKKPKILGKSIFHQLFWQRFLLRKSLFKEDLLFTLDSTTLCRHKNQIILNQDITGFQQDSLKFFRGFSFLTAYLKFLIAKKAIKNCRTYICTSKFSHASISRVISTKNPAGHVIPLASSLRTTELKRDYSLNPKCIKLIYVSPILSYKNHLNILKGLKELKKDFNFKITFVGGGNLKLKDGLLRFIEKNDLVKECEFLPFLERSKLIRLIKSKDIAIFASSIECFGVTLLEYMKLGMPIICSNQSSLPEIIEDGGLTYNPESKNEFITTIIKLILNKNLRESLSERALSISERYSWESTINQTTSILKFYYDK